MEALKEGWEDSSFSEEDFYCSRRRGQVILIGHKVIKVFWFFFSKKNRLLISTRAINDRCCGGEEELDCFASLAMTAE